jgi:hypothetical protein
MPPTWQSVAGAHTCAGARGAEGQICPPGETSHDPKMSSGNLRVRWPGALLVVSLATDQTAMQHANQAIGEGAKPSLAGGIEVKHRKRCPGAPGSVNVPRAPRSLTKP